MFQSYKAVMISDDSSVFGDCNFAPQFPTFVDRLGDTPLKSKTSKM
jgi:hypothetical protein